MADAQVDPMIRGVQTLHCAYDVQIPVVTRAIVRKIVEPESASPTSSTLAPAPPSTQRAMPRSSPRRIRGARCETGSRSLMLITSRGSTRMLRVDRRTEAWKAAGYLNMAWDIPFPPGSGRNRTSLATGRFAWALVTRNYVKIL